MSEPVLLDTHTAIWVSTGAMLASEGRGAIEAASRSDGVHVSPITAWEIAVLVQKNQLTLTMPVDAWFERLLLLEGTSLAGLPPKVLVASRFLPGDPPNDPADRILIATAREFGWTLATRDRLLLKFASEGHLNAVAC